MNFLSDKKLELLFAFTLKSGVFSVLVHDLCPIALDNFIFWFLELFLHVDLY